MKIRELFIISELNGMWTATFALDKGIWEAGNTKEEAIFKLCVSLELIGSDL